MNDQFDNAKDDKAIFEKLASDVKTGAFRAFLIRNFGEIEWQDVPSSIVDAIADGHISWATLEIDDQNDTVSLDFGCTPATDAPEGFDGSVLPFEAWGVSHSFAQRFLDQILGLEYVGTNDGIDNFERADCEDCYELPENGGG
jgi:hypothetical protein